MYILIKLKRNRFDLEMVRKDIKEKLLDRKENLIEKFNNNKNSNINKISKLIDKSIKINND
jgi:hypothetical protein